MVSVGGVESDVDGWNVVMRLIVPDDVVIVSRIDDTQSIDILGTVPKQNLWPLAEFGR